MSKNYHYEDEPPVKKKKGVCMTPGCDGPVTAWVADGDKFPRKMCHSCKTAGHEIDEVISDGNRQCTKAGSFAWRDDLELPYF